MCITKHYYPEPTPLALLGSAEQSTKNGLQIMIQVGFYSHFRILIPALPDPTDVKFYGNPYRNKDTDRDGMNILGLVCFSLVLGYFISIGGEKARPLANVFQALEVVIMNMVSAVIWLVF